MCARSLRAPQPQRPARTARSGPAVQASAVEVFQLADEASLISGTAAVLFACTLVVSYFGCRCVPISAIQATYSFMQCCCKCTNEHRVHL